MELPQKRKVAAYPLNVRHWAECGHRAVLSLRANWAFRPENLSLAAADGEQWT
jgi:hypothetical protein